MKLKLEDNKKFSKKSGDKNKIHISNEHAKKFFIKKPIVHGANILIKVFKNKNFLKNKFNHLEIFFKDFINIDEKFDINTKKNCLIVKGLYNNKIEIYKKFNQNIKNFEQNEIINELVFISKYIGNVSPGPNSLIQQIKFIYSEKHTDKRILKKRIINENVIIISYSYKNLMTEITAIKLRPYKQQFKLNILRSKKIIKLIQSKKIIIYGKNSDLGNFLFNSNLKKFCKVYLLSSKNLSTNILNSDFKKIKPDFIFYFLSPKIINGRSKIIDKNYTNVYLKIPKKIFSILSRYKKEFKVFYPSTIFIDEQEKYKYLKSYINIKKKAEVEFKKKTYKNSFFITRLPQLKTRSNYNPFLGKYIGKKLDYLSKELFNFFKLKY
jgi:hypothetical protein